MKKTRLIATMALTMSIGLTSCSDDKPKVQQATKSVATSQKVVTQAQSYSKIMDFIPAETPILVVFAKDPKNPIPDNLKNKFDKIYASLGDLIKMIIQENIGKYSKDDPKATEMTELMDKWLSEEGIKKLGLSIDENEFAMYAIDLFPVVRMTLAKTHAMNEVLDELMAKAQEKGGMASKKKANGGMVYIYGDKEAQVMVSLAGNTIVASFAPTRDVDKLMPKLLGFEKPAKSLVQSNQYQDTVSEYNYLSNSLYWINIRQIADYFVNPANYDSAMLDIMKIEDKMFSPVCKTEILEIFDKFPRLVGGSTILDEHNLDSHMIIEMTNGLGSKFSNISGRIPNAIGKSALSYGFSFDIEAAQKLAQELVGNIEAAPYKCDMLLGMNVQAATLKSKLNQPLPPFVSNFKGMNIVVNELDLDMTKKDPKEMLKSIKAKVLLAVDNPEALQGMAAMMLPDLQKIGLKLGGDAVNVSSLIPVKGSQMPINLDHVFMAMGKETIGVSLGEGTDVVLTKDVSSDSTESLLNFSIDADLYKNIYKSISSSASPLPDEFKSSFSLQGMMMNDMLWWETETGSFDFTDRGFEIKIDMVY